MSTRLDEFKKLYTGDAERSSLNARHYAHMFVSPYPSSSDIFAAGSDSASDTEPLDTKSLVSKRGVAEEDPAQPLRHKSRSFERGKKCTQRSTKAAGEALVELIYEPCTQDYTVSKFISFTSIFTFTSIFLSTLISIFMSTSNLLHCHSMMNL